LKALAKNPLNRYQSAGEMRADLLRAAAGRPVMATPVMREDDRTAMIAPPPRMMGPATRPVARVAPPRRRGSTGIVVALTLLGVLAVAALAAGLYLANRTPMTDVPTLKGLTQAEANALLQQKHLVAGTPTNDPGTTCPKGKITNQSPEAGVRVPEGSTVGYTL